MSLLYIKLAHKLYSNSNEWTEYRGQSTEKYSGRSTEEYRGRSTEEYRGQSTDKYSINQTRLVCVVGHEILLPLPRQKSTKIESKTAYKLTSIGRCNYRYREKSRLCPTRYRVFLQRKYLDKSRSILSC